MKEEIVLGRLLGNPNATKLHVTVRIYNNANDNFVISFYKNIYTYITALIIDAVAGFTLHERKIFHKDRCNTDDFIFDGSVRDFNGKIQALDRKQDCIDMCTDRVDCVAMEWNPDEGKCRLSSKCTHTMSKSGHMFYVKGKFFRNKETNLSFTKLFA